MEQINDSVDILTVTPLPGSFSRRITKDQMVEPRFFGGAQFQLDTLDLQGRCLHVVRDDMLPGGTKQRGVVRYLEELQALGAQEFVYASPFAGFAQVALAVGAALVGAKCVVYCERDKSTGDANLDQNPRFHSFSKLAQAHGATIHLCEDLAQAHEYSLKHSSQPSIVTLPLGFQCERFIEILTCEVSRVWKRIQHQLGTLPTELWLPVGSGTLMRCFHRVTGGALPLFGVDVRVLPPCDTRIAQLVDLDGVALLRTPEAFSQTARMPPPLPSNAHYDAKLWRHISARARHGALWWNVAR
jgi:hypothetical protein